MKPPADPYAGRPPIQPAIDPLVTLLELTATERPELLPWLLSILPHSAASYMLEQLAEEWEVKPGEIHRRADAAARDLDRLESGGAAEPYRMSLPDLAALFHFALKRRDRLSGIRRRSRLKTIGRQLGSALKVIRRRRQLQSLAGAGGREEPAGDYQWIGEFLGR